MTDPSTTPTPPETAIQKAARLVGGQSELARRLSAIGPPITPQGVGAWCRDEDGRVPSGRVLDVERVTESRVTRYDLRPDLYPAIAAA